MSFEDCLAKGAIKNPPNEQVTWGQFRDFCFCLIRPGNCRGKYGDFVEIFNDDESCSVTFWKNGHLVGGWYEPPIKWEIWYKWALYIKTGLIEEGEGDELLELGF